MGEAILRGQVLEATSWNPLLFSAVAGTLAVAAVSGTRSLLGLPRLRPVLTALEKRVLRLGVVGIAVLNWGYLVLAGV
jgi:hypothetical protein